MISPVAEKVFKHGIFDSLLRIFFELQVFVVGGLNLLISSPHPLFLLSNYFQLNQLKRLFLMILTVYS